MGDSAVRLLLIEDSAGDARLVRAMLDEARAQGMGPAFDITHVPRLSHGLSALADGAFDLILLDLSLPDSSGLDTLAGVLSAAGATPVVVMSGLDDRHVSLQALKAGAQDYLVKGHVDEYSLPRVIQYAIERKRLADILRESQRLESVGVVVGGVAHDFNNLLTGVLTQAHLALYALPADHPAAGHMQKIIKAGLRAAEITQQLLVYVGQGQFRIECLDLNKVISQSLDLMTALVPGQVQVQFLPADGALLTDADRNQLQQVIINLVTNALEALAPAGGLVRISTRRRSLTQAENGALFVHGGALAAGDYVCLEVSDSGVGIEPALLERIFEPFVTTKFTGRGLGLPAVLGIVRSHQGGLQVQSQVGQGSAFTVWLPAA